MEKIRITNSKAKEESPRYRCPKCGASKFCATAHVTQDWRLDESGRYEKTINDFVEQPIIQMKTIFGIAADVILALLAVNFVFMKRIAQPIRSRNSAMFSIIIR